MWWEERRAWQRTSQDPSYQIQMRILGSSRDSSYPIQTSLQCGGYKERKKEVNKPEQTKVSLFVQVFQVQVIATCPSLYSPSSFCPLSVSCCSFVSKKIPFFLFFSPSDILRSWFNNGLIGINALVKSNDQKSAVNKAVPRPTIVTINVRGNASISWLAFLEIHSNPYFFRTDVYVLGVLTSTACLLIVAFTTIFLGMTLSRPKSFRRTLFFQAVLLISSSAWLFSVLVPLTVFHAKRSARVNAYLDGIQLPSYIVNTVENALDITSVYKRIQYRRCFFVLFTLI